MLVREQKLCETLRQKEGGAMVTEGSHQAEHHNSRDFTGTIKHNNSACRVNARHYIGLQKVAKIVSPFFVTPKNISTARRGMKSRG